jgi:hypothetical protein
MACRIVSLVSIALLVGVAVRPISALAEEPSSSEPQRPSVVRLVCNNDVYIAVAGVAGAAIAYLAPRKFTVVGEALAAAIEDNGLRDVVITGVGDKAASLAAPGLCDMVARALDSGATAAPAAPLRPRSSASAPASPPLPTALSCPGGQVYSSLYDKCLKQTPCQANTDFNSFVGTCLPRPPATGYAGETPAKGSAVEMALAPLPAPKAATGCPAGQSYSALFHRCQSIPVCKADEIYDADSVLCFHSVTVIAPNAAALGAFAPKTPLDALPGLTPAAPR